MIDWKRDRDGEKRLDVVRKDHAPFAMVKSAVNVVLVNEVRYSFGSSQALILRPTPPLNPLPAPDRICTRGLATDTPLITPTDRLAT